MKRLLLLWIRGNRTIKMSAGQIALVSERLLALKSAIPVEFARKPRPLMEVDRWKATEFRQFLLYTGKIVLKGVLPDNMYQHFLLFSLGIAILVSPDIATNHIPLANQLLHRFVLEMSPLYGPETMVYNIHSLLHLCDDVQLFGSLDYSSAFPFENFMQTMKRLVRSGKNPLIQIANRLAEAPVAVRNHHMSAISVKRPNNGFVGLNGQCFEVIAKSGPTTYLCRIFHSGKPLFTKPHSASIVDCYSFSLVSHFLRDLSHTTISKASRSILIEQVGKVVFMKLLHRVQ